MGNGSAQSLVFAGTGPIQRSELVGRRQLLRTLRSCPLVAVGHGEKSKNVPIL
jgi:hypothetical protein